VSGGGGGGKKSVVDANRQLLVGSMVPMLRFQGERLKRHPFFNSGEKSSKEEV